MATTTQGPTHAPGSTAPLAARFVDGVRVYGTGETAVRALDGISADVALGEFTTVMGPSGSGKSTLPSRRAARLDVLRAITTE